MYTWLARSCFRHPWRVLGVWIIIIIVAIAAAGGIGSAFGASVSLPDSDSVKGAKILNDHFDGFGAEIGGTVVFRAEQGVNDPTVRSAMTELFEELQTIEEVTIGSPYGGVSGQSPQIAQRGPDAGLVAYANINLGPEIDPSEAPEVGTEINEVVESSGVHTIEGLDVEIGGARLAEREPPESEAIGLAFAVFVLILALGSVTAMGVSVVSALLGVGVGVAVVSLLSNIANVPEFAPTLGIMIGLGVGIDYALFFVSRYRESIDDGYAPDYATVAAIHFAGRSVLFAGLTVVVSLLGLLLIGLDFLAGLGLAAAATVAVVMAGAVTLLPATISLMKDRMATTRLRGLIASALVAVALFGLGVGARFLLLGIPIAVVVLVVGSVGGARNPLRRVLKGRRTKQLHETGWHRLSRVVQARPWLFAVGGTLVLLLLASPLLSLRLGFADEGNYSEDTTTRKAYDLLSDGFGPGANGPLIVASELSGDAGELETLNSLSATLNRTEGIAFATPPVVSPSGGGTIIRVQPTTGPQDAATTELVKTLRSETIPGELQGTEVEAFVAGSVASQIDFTDFLSRRMLIFLVAVLGTSFVLLMAVFRSLVVPLKAVLINLLSIGAAYGVTVAVFQWGWLGGIIGVEPAPIEPYVPLMLFAILFGLSMDYEVFLLSRMKEEYERTGNAEDSVADGLAATARVITAAAAIMVVVFGSFVLEDSRVIKLFGLGLVSAVAIDASLVRMLIVPSTMELLGRRNWWLPTWLDRILPNLKIEGEHRRRSR